MKIKIKNNDYLPVGEYELTNRSKLERAKKSLKGGASKREIFIAYDMLAGRIVDAYGNVTEPQSFWYLERKHKIVKRLVKQEEIKTNSKYGKFIIQTNKVQWLLGLLILSRSLNPNDKQKKYLEDLTLGVLISTYKLFAYNTSSEDKLIVSLVKYNKARIAVAHKMFTDEKLTPGMCVSATKLGDKIIKDLTRNLKQKSNMLKKTDKISDFPKQYNKLVKQMKLLEKRIEKFEKSIKTKRKQKG